MSMGSSHYIVLSGNEADSLPGNLQVMLPQVKEYHFIVIAFCRVLLKFNALKFNVVNKIFIFLSYLLQNETEVVCEVEDLARGVDMETDCSVDVSEETNPNST